MTRFEYLKENLSQELLARYLAEFTNCDKCECRSFCENEVKINDEIDCTDVIYKYLGTEHKNV